MREDALLLLFGAILGLMSGIAGSLFSQILQFNLDKKKQDREHSQQFEVQSRQQTLDLETQMIIRVVENERERGNLSDIIGTIGQITGSSRLDALMRTLSLQDIQNMAKSRSIIEATRISIWGPAGSGKTWLLNAFANKVWQYNTSYQSFSLFDSSGQRFIPDGLASSATTDHTYEGFKFHRRLHQSLSGSSISSYSHEIILMDAPGDETTGHMLKVSDTSNNRAHVHATRQSLLSSDAILFALDPGLGYSNIWSPPPYDESNEFTPPPALYSSEDTSTYEVLFEYLSELLHLIMGRDSQKVPYLCFCITKADKYGTSLDTKNFDELVLRIFGSDFQTNFRQLLATLPDEKVARFVTSSVGYFVRYDGKRVPNYDISSGILMDNKAWNPQGTELPFFWIFEQIERASLTQELFASKENRSITDYQPYPREVS